MPRRRACGYRARVGGFTYLGLLVAIVILGLGMAQIGILWRTQAQRERETELLFVGREFRAAIASYYGAGAHQYPLEVADLLEDTRFSEPKHHLRRFYADPMTGAQDWIILRNEFQGISGIASSSIAEPLKKSGFDSNEDDFKDAKTYGDWKFEYVPRGRIGRAPVTEPPSE
jgi:type II secretory pathway pseudopilin PulG